MTRLIPIPILAFALALLGCDSPPHRPAPLQPEYPRAAALPELFYPEVRTENWYDRDTRAMQNAALWRMGGEVQRPLMLAETTQPATRPTTRPAFFIVGAWAQPASHFPRLKSIGVNTIFGYDGAGGVSKADYERRALEAGLYVVNDPGEDIAAEAAQTNRLAWSQNDEPDLNRWKDSEPPDSPNNSRLVPGPRYKGWTKPSILAERYARCKAAAQHIPVFVNFAGPSITVAAYTHGDMHKAYYASADWGGFDWHIRNANYNRYTLALVELAADRLRDWSGGKPLFVFIEVTQHQYHANARAPTPDEAEAMVNTAVAKGAAGIIYFTHTFKNGWNPGTFPNGWYGVDPPMEDRLIAVGRRLNKDFEVEQLRSENATLKAQNAEHQLRARRAVEILQQP